MAWDEKKLDELVKIWESVRNSYMVGSPSSLDWGYKIRELKTCQVEGPKETEFRMWYVRGEVTRTMYECRACGLSFLMAFTPNFCPRCGLPRKQEEPAPTSPKPGDKRWIPTVPPYPEYFRSDGQWHTEERKGEQRKGKEQIMEGTKRWRCPYCACQLNNSRLGQDRRKDKP